MHEFWKQVYDIATLPLCVLLLSCSLGLRYWRRLPPPFRILVAYAIFNVCIEIAARLCGYFYKQNLPLLHLYTLGEFVLFSFFYRMILSKRSLFSRHFLLFLTSGIILIILNTTFLQGIFEFNSYSKTLVNIVVILFALDYAFAFSDLDEPEPFYGKALRLFNAGVLIYYSGSIFIFMSSQFELETGGALLVLWQVNVVLNLIFQIILLISLWKVIYRPRKLSSLQL